MSETHCAHGRPKPGWCPSCRRDYKHGELWAQKQLLEDPGFRRDVEAIAREHLLKQSQDRCRSAVMAAMRDRQRIEKALALREGVWWEELAPLLPQERTIVMNQLKLQWNVRSDEVFADPDAELKSMAREKLEEVQQTEEEDRLLQ